MRRRTQLITQERLKELLLYDPVAGTWVWRVRRQPNKKPGDPAGFVTKYGYHVVFVEGRFYMAARLAALWMTGTWPVEEVDHHNVIYDDDKWDNLRPASRSQNCANRRKFKNNTSGMKGVSFDKGTGKFKSYIQHKNHFYNLGFYSTVEEAGAAYAVRAKELFGEFARVG